MKGMPNVFKWNMQDCNKSFCAYWTEICWEFADRFTIKVLKLKDKPFHVFWRELCWEFAEKFARSSI